MHVYETDTKVLSESDLVRLSLVCSAHQIHPASVDDLAFLGDLDSRNAARWTIEGPLVHVPGDPGEPTNCTITPEIAYSLDSEDPGDDWKPYKPGKYRLRSVKARITITRPSTAYEFRVTQLGIRADRVSAPHRALKVASGISDVIPSGMCSLAVREFEVLGTLEIEAGGHLEILR